jgi:hypothetical protein
MGILHETDNLLALYEHAIGTSRVPKVLHQWCAVAGVAACLEDRVFVEKLDNPLNPSLWTFLIAPSACGKGTAIKELMKYIGPLNAEGHINLYYGDVTAQALKKVMSGKPKQETPHHRSKQFLVNEEAAACIRSGGLARDFIVHMTANYDIPPGIAYKASTLTNGAMATYDQCINWLLGSNIQWAVDSIPKDAIDGGFLGRLLPIVIDDYDPRNKGRGERPPDFEDVQYVLHERFKELCEIRGQFRVSNLARECHDRWDQTREIPKDERLRATYVRMDDNVWKLAQSFSAAERPQDLLIKERHMEQAIKAATSLLPGAIKLLNASAVTERTKDYEIVLKLLKKHKGPIRHSVLMQRLAGYGIDKMGMMRAIEMVKHVGKLTEGTVKGDSGRSSKVYRFRERWAD